MKIDRNYETEEFTACQLNERFNSPDTTLFTALSTIHASVHRRTHQVTPIQIKKWRQASPVF
jgi:hypothetical protein